MRREGASAIDAAARDAILARIASIPSTATLGLERIELADGRCSLFAPRSRGHDGIFDSLHGGIVTTVADSAAAFAILTRVGADAALATTDVSLRFLARCTTGIHVDAEVVKLGRALVPVHVDVFDEAHRHVATGHVCYMRFRSRDER
ncbi:PaaI family thioesterase [Sandaracinus amylolyticus]|uniref:PaaI family thioesterase n=1 Tax=Sandaracinus amylolyticus TaxID=927083 RepID=UPI001F2032BB|nr:PaaI family thioesterase [Sandaracinus amylolyticus]UJR86415.1 Hypothetical protein I5071_85100 [Sandaracinus amylolyticus]